MSKSIWKTGTPKKRGRYAVITKYNRITCIDFSKNHNLWNASDRDTETRAKELAIEKEYIKYYTSPKELIELVEAEIEAEKDTDIEADNEADTDTDIEADTERP